MEQLVSAIKYYGEKNYIDIDFFTDVLVVKDHNGIRIEQWNISDKLLQPSMEVLEALEPEAVLYYGKQSKLEELKEKFDCALENSCITSSLGFDVDANTSSVRNIGALLVIMGSEDVESFCDYNNKMHSLTKKQIETLYVEIIKHIRSLYSKKWEYRDKINSLTAQEEINNIVIEFNT